MTDDIQEFFRHWIRNLADTGRRLLSYTGQLIILVIVILIFFLPIAVSTGFYITGTPLPEILDYLGYIALIQAVWQTLLGTAIEAMDDTWGEDS